MPKFLLNDFVLVAIMRVTTAADEKKVREARRRRELDRKFKGMLREIVWQFILLCLILWVIVGGRDANVFYQNQDIKNVFLEDYEVCQRCVT